MAGNVLPVDAFDTQRIEELEQEAAHFSPSLGVVFLHTMTGFPMESCRTWHDHILKQALLDKDTNGHILRLT